MRIGGETTIAAGGDTSERAVQKEGRWRSHAYKAYTGNDMGDSRTVSSTLLVASVGKGRQQGEGKKLG